MTYLHTIATVPNSPITDTSLVPHHQAGSLSPAPSGRQKGPICDHSFADLVRLCKCSTTTVQRAIWEL